jgi:hypothetical protein
MEKGKPLAHISQVSKQNNRSRFMTPCDKALTV